MTCALVIAGPHAAGETVESGVVNRTSFHSGTRLTQARAVGRLLGLALHQSAPGKD